MRGAFGGEEFVGEALAFGEAGGVGIDGSGFDAPISQLPRELMEHVANRWERDGVPIVVNDANSQLSIKEFLLYGEGVRTGPPPFLRTHIRIGFPHLAFLNYLHEKGDVIQIRRNRPYHCLQRYFPTLFFLPRHQSLRANPPLPRLQPHNPVHRGGNPDTTANIGAHPHDGAPHLHQRCFPAGTAPRGPLPPIHGVQHPPEDVVDTVHGEHCLRNIGLAVNDCASGEEKVDEGCGRGGGLECEGGNADCGVYAGDVKGVFYGDGEAVKGAEREGCAGEVVVEEAGTGEGGGEEGFRDVLQKLVGYGGSLQKGLCELPGPNGIMVIWGSKCGLFAPCKKRW